MRAQDQNAKCVDSAQHEGSIPHEGFSASASADFRNQFSARSTADHIIAGAWAARNNATVCGPAGNAGRSTD